MVSAVPEVKFNWEAVVVGMQGNIDLGHIMGSNPVVLYGLPIGLMGHKKRTSMRVCGWKATIAAHGDV